MILDLSKIYIGWYFMSQTLAGFLFYSMEILIAFNKLLTCFQFWPIGSLDPNIFILNPCCRKNKAGYLSSSLRVEIVQFVTWHFYRLLPIVTPMSSAVKKNSNGVVCQIPLIPAVVSKMMVLIASSWSLFGTHGKITWS